jgi:hypothetical protein
MQKSCFQNFLFSVFSFCASSIYMQYIISVVRWSTFVNPFFKKMAQFVGNHE